MLSHFVLDFLMASVLLHGGAAQPLSKFVCFYRTIPLSNRLWFYIVLNTPRHVHPPCKPCSVSSRSCKSPKQMIKLLAVLEPFACYDNLDDAANDLNWMKAQMESGWVNAALACEGRRGFIHTFPDSRESVNGKIVFIHESVSVQWSRDISWNNEDINSQLMILKQLEDRFEVTYRPWVTHRKAMLQQYGWCSYVGCWDCFFGGPDLGLDLRYVHWPLEDFKLNSI